MTKNTKRIIRSIGISLCFSTGLTLINGHDWKWWLGASCLSYLGLGILAAIASGYKKAEEEQKDSAKDRVDKWAEKVKKRNTPNP